MDPAHHCLGVSQELWEEMKTFACCHFRPTVLLMRVNEESEDEGRR